MPYQRTYIIILCFFLVSVKAQLKQGFWRGVITLNSKKNAEVPFNFQLITTKAKTQLIIQNGEEQITVTEVIVKKDSLIFKMPVFDSEFRTKIVGDTALVGNWINHSKKMNTTLAFNATFGNPSRFLFTPGKPNLAFQGEWEVMFNPNRIDSSKAIGVFYFSYGSAYCMGTFLTETGDYRYLEGMVHQNKLYLSGFDGAHVFLFTAETDGVTITNGEFYSGADGYETFIGKRNPDFKLRDPEKITMLKTRDSIINFSFLNLHKQKISLSDKRYANKPVIIQIMGTWCPNCMDETAYLSKLHKQYSKKGLEVIGLAYERSAEFGKSKRNVLRLKKRYVIDYEILITGLTGKNKASESLPFLNSISAFPTTILVDKKHKVVSIYTGFNGPATGNAYDDFKIKFENSVKKLLSN